MAGAPCYPPNRPGKRVPRLAPGQAKVSVMGAPYASRRPPRPRSTGLRLEIWPSYAHISSPRLVGSACILTILCRGLGVCSLWGLIRGPISDKWYAVIPLMASKVS
jgi:hypothetical protein